MFKRMQVMALGLLVGIAAIATSEVASAQEVFKNKYLSKEAISQKTKLRLTLKYFQGIDLKVLNYAQQRLGQQVGRGECWDLAKYALESAGAKVPGQDLGVYEYGRRLNNGEAIRPGDVMQFEGVRFQTSNSYQNYPHHTAIVEQVQGTRIHLLHQNVNGVRTVQRGVIDLSTKTAGTIATYRPQPK